MFGYFLGLEVTFWVILVIFVYILEAQFLRQKMTNIFTSLQTTF